MNHKDLEVWKTGMDLVETIYKITEKFPKTERYGLTQQMRRAAVSIPSNIAEGSARKGNKEIVQFTSLSLGSLAELETQMLIAYRLKYIDNKDAIQNEIEHVRRLLIGFRNHLKRTEKS